MTQFHSDSCKRSSLERFIVRTFLPITLCLGSATPSMAQVYGRAAALNVTPSLPAASDNEYGIDTSMTCPSPRFTIGGFVGTGNDRATINDPYALSTSNINQYGIAAGISVPFGTSLGQFCEEYATGRLELQRIQNENSLRNAQLVLISQCYWLKTNGFLSENKEQFEKTPEFSSLSVCSKIDLKRGTASVVNPLTEGPPKADTPPPPTAPLIFQNDRRRN
jgi:hypothetical protein